MAKHLDMTPVAVMGSMKLPPVTTFDNNNLAPGTPGAQDTNSCQKGKKAENCGDVQPMISRSVHVEW